MKTESERIELALQFAYHYGQIDGDHHKALVIDQMVRSLTGSKEAYQEFIGSNWNEGIAP
jgi:hypothetical protein